jgi:hypothetical protein
VQPASAGQPAVQEVSGHTMGVAFQVLLHSAVSAASFGTK